VTDRQAQNLQGLLLRQKRLSLARDEWATDIFKNNELNELDELGLFLRYVLFYFLYQQTSWFNFSYSLFLLDIYRTIIVTVFS